ncbi:c-type cytochrome [Pontibacter chitinilyticus]|uniref:c-type cytochrome n=1 Tax=Pontibacter chitinilyticus TaxID=2674989 RepID=UPI00321B7860
MKKAAKIVGYVLVVLVGAVAAGVLYLQYAFPNVDAAPVITIAKTPILVKRGEYLANHVAVCIDCHSTRDWSRLTAPPLPGTMGKGGDKFDHSLGFPGTFYARNITSDKESGIGAWTDGEVYRAITSGVSRNGDPLFPMMPYKAYSQMSQEDAYAIVAYIRTLSPIKNKVPASDPDFPVSLFLRTMPSNIPTLAAEPVLKDSVALGKYLVTIAGCSDCHTAGDKGAYMAGGNEFHFPNGATLRTANLTPDKETGIGNWTETAFVSRFKSFTDPANTPKVDPKGFNTLMPWSMYGGMEAGDLRAIYKYLHSLKPEKNKVVKFTPGPDTAPAAS